MSQIKYPLLSNQVWLRQSYEVKLLTTGQIARIVGGCTRAAVRYSLRRYHIERVERLPKLRDKAWLRQKYEAENQSTRCIGKSLRCSPTSVASALRSLGILVRSSSEARAAAGSRSYKYPALNDPDWLRKKYVEDELSTVEMCKLAGAKTPNSARQALIRHGISVRDLSDGATAGRKDDGFVLNKAVIEGGLLGDASLRVYNRLSEQSYPYFHRKNKFLEHVEWISRLLCGEQGPSHITPYRRIVDGRIFSHYLFRTLSHKELLPFYRRWYPERSGFKKVIPQDIEVNETVLLHWFLDDGSSYNRKRNYPTHWTQKQQQIEIQFCSESFTEEDQEMLCTKIAMKFPLTPRLKGVKRGAGHRTVLPQSQAAVFFEILGPPPVQSLAYKWRLTTSHTV